VGYPILGKFDSAFLKRFASIQDIETAEMLSRVCGEFFTAHGDSITEDSAFSSGRDYYSRPRHRSVGARSRCGSSSPK
jgi:hypothetical protein